MEAQEKLPSSLLELAGVFDEQRGRASADRSAYECCQYHHRFAERIQPVIESRVTSCLCATMIWRPTLDDAQLGTQMTFPLLMKNELENSNHKNHRRSEYEE